MPTVADSATELQTKIPAYDGVPADYQELVIDAVNDYSTKRPLRKIATIAVVNGTASYALPSDFVILISITGVTSNQGAFVDGDGFIVPTSKGFTETYTIANGQITFYPTPQYTLNKTLEYGAGYLVADEMTADFAKSDWSIVKHLAQSFVLSEQANKAARNAFRVSTGAETIDKQKQSAVLQDASGREAAVYEAAVSRASGGDASGIRSVYSGVNPYA